jgi:DNA-binding IclR family transcriptional regulator
MISKQRSGERNIGVEKPPETKEAGGRGDDAEQLDSVAVVLQLIELLAAAPRPLQLSAIARELRLSKPRAWRNLRTLVSRGYARQDPETDRYEIGVKLLTLGESVRERFGILAAARPEMAVLRDETGHAVTLSTLIEGEVTILELIQGRTLVEFGVRPSSRLPMHSSAHGHVTLAFGPPELLSRVLASKLPAWTDHTITDPERLREVVAVTRQRGWATAAEQVLLGVNTLAAPVRDHRGVLAGALAIVGSSQFIAAQPSDSQIGLVTGAAARISRRLGWGEV